MIGSSLQDTRHTYRPRPEHLAASQVLNDTQARKQVKISDDDGKSTNTWSRDRWLSGAAVTSQVTTKGTRHLASHCRLFLRSGLMNTWQS